MFKSKWHFKLLVNRTNIIHLCFFSKWEANIFPYFYCPSNLAVFLKVVLWLFWAYLWFCFLGVFDSSEWFVFPGLYHSHAFHSFPGAKHGGERWTTAGTFKRSICTVCKISILLCGAPCFAFILHPRSNHWAPEFVNRHNTAFLPGISKRSKEFSFKFNLENWGKWN